MSWGQNFEPQGVEPSIDFADIRGIRLIRASWQAEGSQSETSRETKRPVHASGLVLEYFRRAAYKMCFLSEMSANSCFNRLFSSHACCSWQSLLPFRCRYFLFRRRRLVSLR